MTYDEILQYISQMQAQPVDLAASMAGNPNETTPNVAWGGSNVAWGNVPGMERFYSYDQANNAENFNLQEAWPEIQRLGYQVMQGFNPGDETSASWVVGPDGQPIAQSARMTGTNDDRFKLAALAAMGGTAANIGLASGALGGGNALAGGVPSSAWDGAMMAGADATYTGAMPGAAAMASGGGAAGGVGAAGGAAGAAGGGGLAGLGGSMGSLWPQLAQTGAGLLGQYLSSNAMGDANDASMQLMERMYLQNRADNQPLVDLRNQQLPRINALMSDPSSIANTEDYKFQYGEGLNALNNRAAASGNIYSGNQMKRAQEYGQNFAGTKLDQSLNRLIGAANLGQVGSNNNQDNTNRYGTQGSNALQQGGAIRGSGYMGMANTIGSGIADYTEGNFWNNYMRGRP